MRRHGRKTERYAAANAAQRGTQERPLDWYERVWFVTEARARDWRRSHHGREMNIISWNALWEKVRDELFGAAWACESRRSFATPMALA